MTPFSHLLASMHQAGHSSTVHVPPDWQQGRTTYGGLTAALCVQAALRAVPALPPLRSAQFTFAGPAAGDVGITTTILRRGKSTVFVGADLHGEHGLATHATLSFAAERASTIAYQHLPAPQVAPPDECPPFFGAQAPTFSHHFDYRNAGAPTPASAAETPEFLIWLRHRDELAGAAAPALVALADAPPPAAMALFKAPAPISTMTWSVDFFTPPPEQPNPWRLIRSRAEMAGHGYSTQAIALWTQTGEPLLMAQQNIAVFV